MIVRVYKNLHKDCWSVVKHSTGKVIAHVDEVLLHNCSFIVQPGGRARVIKTKRKNVHAFVLGEWTKKDYKMLKKHPFLPQTHLTGFVGSKITYNPYKSSAFLIDTVSKPIHYADAVLLGKNGVYAR